ncbi:hypothetical protein FBQ95_16920 [Chloroflexi bacterium CFX3]|nr:hypothetical protein [Chloroflexi bacterium CFX3]
MKTGINLKLEINLGGLFIAALVVGVAISFATFRRPPRRKRTPPSAPFAPISSQPGESAEPRPESAPQADGDQTVSSAESAPQQRGGHIFSRPMTEMASSVRVERASEPMPRLYTHAEIEAMRERGRADARAYAEQLMQKLPPHGRKAFAQRIPIIQAKARGLVEGFWRNLAGGVS